MIAPDQCGPDNATFPLGQVYVTNNALHTLTQTELALGLGRHMHRDWGDLDQNDKQANNRALEVGARIVSAYHSQAGKKFYIITEADRSMTTILMAEDY